jgi:hypothetical protein
LKSLIQFRPDAVLATHPTGLVIVFLYVENLNFSVSTLSSPETLRKPSCSCQAQVAQFRVEYFGILNRADFSPQLFDSTRIEANPVSSYANSVKELECLPQ